MNLRFVSKALYNSATQQLFSTFYMKNDASSIISYQAVLSYCHLSKVVRQINFITRQDPEAEDPEVEDPEAEDPEVKPSVLYGDFTEALQSTCKFPNLDGVGVHFSKQCTTVDPDRYYERPANESAEFRSGVLKALFRGLNNPEWRQV